MAMLRGDGLIVGAERLCGRYVILHVWKDKRVRRISFKPKSLRDMDHTAKILEGARGYKLRSIQS